MSDQQEKETRSKTLKLKGTLTLGKNAGAPQVRQSLAYGRSKTVTVEVKRKQILDPEQTGAEGQAVGHAGRAQDDHLTQDERAVRERALQAALERRPSDDKKSPAESGRNLDLTSLGNENAEEQQKDSAPKTRDDLRRQELLELQRIEEEERHKAEEERRKFESERSEIVSTAPPAQLVAKNRTKAAEDKFDAEEAKRSGRGDMRVRREEPRRRSGKLTVAKALQGEEEAYHERSLASLRRARAKERRRNTAQQMPQEKIVRDVIIPETITVQELANRMAERGAEVIKSLLNNGVMATITQTIDGDSAELIAQEFGHRVKRVAAADVEIGLVGKEDRPEDMKPRPPVITVMGHVDHGKTSLLDAIRATDIVQGEAGGITQHIGAYQVKAKNGALLTFIDTPGHEAFTAMRARGADITDIVVLVVAANDSVMPQTIEAINHIKAAKVPMIVAINKCDLEDANPDRVRTDLLQHDVVVEQMGGEIQSVLVSAKTGKGLSDLEEAIALQAELMELQANPDRMAEGVVIEAKLERGRGTVMTVLVQRGTVKVGDIFVSGAQWGRIRALNDDHGKVVELAGPATPVEVLGGSGAPLAGDDFVIVGNENRAREIADFRSKKRREAEQLANNRGSLEQMMSNMQDAKQRNHLAVVIKGDVQGSVEAIANSLRKITEERDEIKSELQVDVIHTGVGAINESDVTLANASQALIIGFNVRANPQARQAARRDQIDIRYYNIIYDVLDDMKQILSGMLSPELRETLLGYAEIREVFTISKIGKIGGCYVTEGLVKRGAKVRLLRDDVVIHTGNLKTLKRFKDEVREVREGYECGMGFENYEDIRPGDVIEAFEVTQTARAL